MKPILLTVVAAGWAAYSQAAPVVTIHADQPAARINPAMWGVFFEDINLGELNGYAAA